MCDMMCLIHKVSIKMHRETQCHLFLPIVSVAAEITAAR